MKPPGGNVTILILAMLNVHVKLTLIICASYSLYYF